MFQTWTEYLVIEKVDLRMTYVWYVIFRPMRTDREWRWSHAFVMCVRTRHVCGEWSRTLCGLQRPSKAMTDFWLDNLHVSLATTGWWREKRSAGRERESQGRAGQFRKKGRGGWCWKGREQLHWCPSECRSPTLLCISSYGFTRNLVANSKAFLFSYNWIWYKFLLTVNQVCGEKGCFWGSNIQSLVLPSLWASFSFHFCGRKLDKKHKTSCIVIKAKWEVVTISSSLMTQVEQLASKSHVSLRSWKEVDRNVAVMMMFCCETCK